MYTLEFPEGRAERTGVMNLYWRRPLAGRSKSVEEKFSQSSQQNW